MSRTLIPCLVAALALSGLAGCDAFDGEMSCTAKEGGQPTQCQEFTDFSAASKITAQASLEILCKGLGASLSDGRCSRDGALAGCRNDYQGQWTKTTWYYASEATPDAASVSCGSDVRVSPDGTEAPAPQACSGPGVTSVDPTFVNESGRTVSAFWVDTACAETYYWTLAAGESRVQQTFVGHVWRFREGDGNPAGALVKEVTLLAADGATPTLAIR